VESFAGPADIWLPVLALSAESTTQHTYRIPNWLTLFLIQRNYACIQGVCHVPALPPDETALAWPATRQVGALHEYLSDTLAYHQRGIAGVTGVTRRYSARMGAGVWAGYRIATLKGHPLVYRMKMYADTGHTHRGWAGIALARSRKLRNAPLSLRTRAIDIEHDLQQNGFAMRCWLLDYPGCGGPIQSGINYLSIRTVICHCLNQCCASATTLAGPVRQST